MALLFLVSGIGKLTRVVATQHYMEAFGVPGVLLWPAAVLEISGGVLLLLGLGMRAVGFLLAGWCLLTACIFHTHISDPNQMVMLLKNLTMAGGFLVLTRAGAGAVSIDGLRASRFATDL